MRKLRAIVIVGLAVCLVGGGSVRAIEPPANLVLRVVQTGQAGATGNDVVELFNPTATAIDITGWKLQYRAAASTGSDSWMTKRTVACIAEAAGCTVVLEPGGYLVFSTYDVPGIVGEQPLASGLSDTGGQLRVAQPGTVGSTVVVHDIVGYGTAAEAEGGLAAPAPGTGEVLVRASVDGVPADTNNNGADFVLYPAACYQPGVIDTECATPNEDEDSPGSTEPEPVVPPADNPTEDEAPATPTPPVGETPDPETPPADESDQPGLGAAPVEYAPISITELLPDPASPFLDSQDEFIELHNPGSIPVNVQGYVLQSGSDFRYRYVIPALTIPAGGYSAIFSANSRLALSNSGSSVRLLNPAGLVIDEIMPYGKAKEGQVWVKDGAAWVWSTTVTPGSANLITLPAPKGLAIPASLTKKPAAKKASSTKKSQPKAKSSSASKVASASNSVADAEQDGEEQNQPVNLGMLLPIGLLALGYGVYEYRKDIGRLGRKVLRRGEPTAEEPGAKTKAIQRKG